MPKWSHYLEDEEEDRETNFQKIKRGQRNKPDEDAIRKEMLKLRSTPTKQKQM